MDDDARGRTERNRASRDGAKPPAPELFRGSVERAEGRRTRGELRSSRCRRLTRDVYAAADAIVDDRARILAAALSAGPSAVVTGWSACALHELDVAPGDVPVELAVVDRRLRRTDLVARRQRITEDETTEIDGVRVTTALRTAYDLATRTPLVDAVVAADALGWLGEFVGADLAEYSRRHVGKRGYRRVARIAELMHPLSESPMETRTRLTIVLAGLPVPVVQYEVRGDNGWFVGRVDLAWPEYRLAVEYDGRDHALDDRRGLDLDRIDNIEREGWKVIVVTGRQVRARRRLVERVWEDLVARGWDAPRVLVPRRPVRVGTNSGVAVPCRAGARR